MQIKSNTAGKLNKIIKGSVFSNEFIFIKEFFQNSQRAKATSVDIKIDNHSLIFKDNGVGCKNPSNLLTLDLSEWDTTNEGFGIGFWSCLAFKGVKKILLRSYNWLAEILIDDILNGNLNINLKDNLEINDGFKITLETDHMDEYRIAKLETKIENVAQYLNLNTICNDKTIEKNNIFSNVKGDFIKDVNNKYFTARLSISKYISSYVKLFYDNRESGHFYNANYIDGIVEPKPKMLTFKEPDRDTYVIDNVYSKFKEKLVEEIKYLYLDFIKSNPSKDILDKYANAINEYLDVNDYEEYMDFSSLLSKNIDDSNESCDTDTCTDNVNNLDNDTNENETENSEDNIEEESVILYDNNIEYAISEEDYHKDDYVVQQNATTNHNDEDSTSHINKPINNFKEFKEYINNKNKLVWVLKEEIQNYKDQISKALYINMEVMKVDNILYANVFKKYNKMHISELDNSLIETFSYKNIILKNNKEIRFIKNLIPICNKYNLPYNTFVIGDIEVTRELVYKDKVLYKEKSFNKKGKISVFAVKSNDFIILDRKALNLSRFNLQQDKPFGINDLKAVFANLNTIAHELAHLIYGTNDNTIEHYTTESKIQSEITELYI